MRPWLILVLLVPIAASAPVSVGSAVLQGDALVTGELGALRIGSSEGGPSSFLATGELRMDYVSSTEPQGTPAGAIQPSRRGGNDFQGAGALSAVLNSDAFEIFVATRGNATVEAQGRDMTIAPDAERDVEPTPYAWTNRHEPATLVQPFQVDASGLDVTVEGRFMVVLWSWDYVFQAADRAVEGWTGEQIRNTTTLPDGTVVAQDIEYKTGYLSVNGTLTLEGVTDLQQLFVADPVGHAADGVRLDVPIGPAPARIEPMWIDEETMWIDPQPSELSPQLGQQGTTVPEAGASGSGFKITLWILAVALAVAIVVRLLAERAVRRAGIALRLGLHGDAEAVVRLWVRLHPRAQALHDLATSASELRPATRLLLAKQRLGAGDATGARQQLAQALSEDVDLWGAAVDDADLRPLALALLDDPVRA